MHPNTNKIVPQQFKDFTKDYVISLASTQNYSYVEVEKSIDIESSLYNNSKTNSKEVHKLSMSIDGLACEYYTSLYIPVNVPDIARTAYYNANAPQDNQAFFQVQIFAITLPYEIENLYVESRTNITINNIMGWSTVRFRDSKKVQLEGNFNSFFRVYAPLNEELTAFTILAPNIMLLLLQNAGDYDFEFSRNKIYFYQTVAYSVAGKISINKKSYDELLDFGVKSAKLLARAARPAKSLNASDVAMWQLHSPGGSVVGVMLKVSATIFFTFLCLIIPFLWPIALIFGLIILNRYRRFLKKRKQLIEQYAG